MGFEIIIYDLSGKQIKSENIYNDTPEFEMDLSDLKSGCYYYTIGNAKDVGFTGELILK